MAKMILMVAVAVGMLWAIGGAALEIGESVKVKSEQRYEMLK